MSSVSSNGFLKRNLLVYLGIFVGVYYLFLNIGVKIFLGVHPFFNFALIVGVFVSLLLAIFICLGSFYYYSHKAKDSTILVLAIISIVMSILGLFGIQFMLSLLKNLNFGSSSSNVQYIGLISSSMRIYNWSFYFAYLTGLYSLILCLDMHKIMIVPKIHNCYLKSLSVQENTLHQVINNENSLQLPPRKSNKNIFIVFGIVMSLIFVCGGGYYIYRTFFQITKINLVESVELSCLGTDGSGKALITALSDYQGNNHNIKDFLESVDYQMVETDEVENGELSNGQKVTVIAKYSQSDADRNNIRITNDTVEVEVSGLIKVYTDSSQIPQELLENMKSDVDKKAQNYSTTNSAIKRTVEFDSMYFATSKLKATHVIAVYKQTTQNFIDKNNPDDVKYIAYYIKNPKSTYSEEETWSMRYLYNPGYKTITKNEEIKPAILANFSINESSLQELKVSTGQTSSNADEYI
ncbi:MAG: hypothetical protein RR428_00215 [Coprobacillus sp.]